MKPYFQDGTYKVEVVDQGLSMSSTSKPQIWLRVKVLESLDRPEEVLNQYERTIYWTITEKTIDFTLDKLELLGFSGQSFRDMDPNVEGHQSFVGRVIDCYCKVETYEGKEREKWDLANPGMKTPDPLGDSDARKLDALFGRKLKEKFRSSSVAVKPKEAKAETVAPAEPVAVADDNDDIPF